MAAHKKEKSMALNVGDTVQLKSGSPAMTVADVYTDDKGVWVAKCVWFSETQDRSAVYPVSVLREVIKA